MVAQGEYHERMATFRRAPNGAKPSFALRVLFIRQQNYWTAEYAFNLGNRNTMFLALLPIAAIPIEARKFNILLLAIM